MTPAGAFTVVHSFDGVTGAEPAGGLVEASDHNLYGTTEFGGPENAGVVFRFKLSPCEDTLTPRLRRKHADDAIRDQKFDACRLRRLARERVRYRAAVDRSDS